MSVIVTHRSEKQLRAYFGSAIAALMTAAMLVLSGCANNTGLSNRPAFYTNLAQPGARLNESNARDMINGYRSSNGVTQVQLNSSLNTLARSYAAALAANARTAPNVRPDGRLKSRLISVGYNAADVDESVTAGYYTFAEAFSGWRDSNTHRKVMLKANATEMGIAAAYAPNTKYKVYWVLIMARPAG
ncbi:MAG: CAP domain-containing protein [Pseudomonadota bacterium]